MIQAPLIYLFGYPGVGKTTIARALENRTEYLAVQNHMLSNALRQAISLQPKDRYPELEPLLKHHTMKAWVNFMEFVSAAVPDQGLIMTSVLYENDPERVEFFELMRNWAQSQGRSFLPVRLVCDPAELARRIESPSRENQLKLHDRKILQQIMETNTLLNPLGVFEVDVTALTANEAAVKILDQISVL